MLPPRQARFVEEYLIDLNATQAAIRAGYSAPVCVDPKAFCVYLLTDAGGEVFYVGKGTGRRYSHHVKNAMSAKPDNGEKCLRILDIMNNGRKVVPLCIADGLSSDEAFDLERSLINAIGIQKLTNIDPGNISLIERSKMKAKALGMRLKPFSEWLSDRHRSSLEIEIAKRAYAEIDHVSAFGQISEIRITGGKVEFA